MEGVEMIPDDAFKESGSKPIPCHPQTHSFSQAQSGSVSISYRAYCQALACGIVSGKTGQYHHHYRPCFDSDRIQDNREPEPSHLHPSKLARLQARGLGNHQK